MISSHPRGKIDVARLGAAGMRRRVCIQARMHEARGQVPSEVDRRVAGGWGRVVEEIRMGREPLHLGDRVRICGAWFSVPPIKSQGAEVVAMRSRLSRDWEDDSGRG